jgi:hypothetical protein
MKKVLIITYYWPPSGGPGVQRWLKFVKYFRNFNIEPIVYTVKNPSYPIIDESLKKEIPESVEVLSQPIWEPNNFLSLFGKKKNESAGFLNPNPSVFGKLIQYIRANHFIPDARKFWVKPSVRYLERYLKKHKVDVVITTGPPHSVHLIGLKLKKITGIKWIADFRDPWTAIDYFHQLPLSKKAIKTHYYLENKVLTKADAVLVVGNEMNKNYCKLSGNVFTVSNGFDGEIVEDHPDLDSRFTLTHIGLMNADRNPSMLWEVLSELVNEDQNFSNDFKLKLIGKVDESVVKAISENNLSKHVKVIDYMSHNEVVEHQRKSQVLLLIVNNVPSAKGIITGKIFEYLMARRPILAIAPSSGDLIDIINSTNSGIAVEFLDKDFLKNTILELYSKFKQEKLIVDSKNIDQYHRKELTKKVSGIINKITG